MDKDNDLEKIKRYEDSSHKVLLLEKYIEEQQSTLEQLQEENEQLKRENSAMKEEQNEMIAHLKKQNEQLRQMIKENVFQRYREGSLADLEFKAIAYDDIVKLEMSYESEPKVIVICRQGKKEKVKSFCQMFIPFGITYEIKEMINNG